MGRTVAAVKRMSVTTELNASATLLTREGYGVVCNDRCPGGVVVSGAHQQSCALEQAAGERWCRRALSRFACAPPKFRLSTVAKLQNQAQSNRIPRSEHIYITCVCGLLAGTSVSLFTEYHDTANSGDSSGITKALSCTPTPLLSPYASPLLLQSFLRSSHFVRPASAHSLAPKDVL